MSSTGQKTRNKNTMLTITSVNPLTFFNPATEAAARTSIRTSNDYDLIARTYADVGDLLLNRPDLIEKITVQEKTAALYSPISAASSLRDPLNVIDQRLTSQSKFLSSALADLEVRLQISGLSKTITLPIPPPVPALQNKKSPLNNTII